MRDPRPGDIRSQAYDSEFTATLTHALAKTIVAASGTDQPRIIALRLDETADALIQLLTLVALIDPRIDSAATLDQLADRITSIRARRA